jgi:hypothetical protein
MRSLVILVCFAGLAGCAGPQTSTDLAEHTPGDWHAFTLPGKRATQYSVSQSDGRWRVHARADPSASQWRRKLHEAAASPTRLRFSWRVDRLIDDADLTDADRSDSPARLVVAFDGDHSRLSPRTRMMFELAEALTGETPPYATLMYVWDNRLPVESIVRGARSDRVRKIVLESGAAHLGRWCAHERDIVQDYRRAFGEDPGRVIGVALMTDADNTQGVAEAWYGDLELR